MLGPGSIEQAHGDVEWVEIAELEVADLDARSNAGQATKLEHQRAVIALRVKKQQLEVVEGILQVQRDAAQREFERTKQLFDAGRASQAELDAAQAQLQVVSRKF